MSTWPHSALPFPAGIDSLEFSVAKLAIFIDGGYAAKVAADHLRIRVDYEKLSDEIRNRIAEGGEEPIDLLRTCFHDCLPCRSNPPTPDEAVGFAGKREFFAALRRLPKYKVREGRPRFRGTDAQGRPIFRQERVDPMIGLDIAGLATKDRITHIAVFAGGSDLLPAVEEAQREGVTFRLAHGPEGSRASDPWDMADERFAVDDAGFIGKIQRVKQI